MSSPHWQELPSEFKKNVIDLLDFKARHRLSTCSKSDNDFVQKCLMSLLESSINFYPRQVNMFIKSSDGRFEQVMKKKPSDDTQLISGLVLKVFESSEITMFRILNAAESESSIDKVLSTIKNRQSSKFKSKGLSYCGLTSSDLCWKHLECFDSEYLANLEIYNCRDEISKLQRKKIVKMEQWRRLKSLKCDRDIWKSFLVEDFSCLETIELNVSHFKAPDIINLIKTFQKTQKASFQITGLKDPCINQFVKSTEKISTFIENRYLLEKYKVNDDENVELHVWFYGEQGRGERGKQVVKVEGSYQKKL